MIGLPAGTKIWIVAGITDMRNDFNGLGAKVQTTLKEDAQGYGLQGVSAVGSAKAKEEKKDFLSHILEQLNDLFGTEMTDGDKLDWLQGMASKIAENQPLMEQVRNYPRDTIMPGDFPKAVDAAVIERMDIQNGMSLDYLSRPDAANRIQSLLLELLLKGPGNTGLEG